MRPLENLRTLVGPMSGRAGNDGARSRTGNAMKPTSKAINGSTKMKAMPPVFSLQPT